MPQKKNPDAAELIRAKIGRILGANVALLTVMKGLPLTYSKDMQEDKEQVFDAADTLMLALAAMEGMVRDMQANVTSPGGGGRPRGFPPRPISPTGWCANWTCRFATRIMSPVRWWPWPRRADATCRTCRLPT
jgi:hypothetical protein